MDSIEEIYRNRIAALTRALYAVRCVKEDNVPSKIEEGLFLGSVGAASNKNALKSLNITHILTVANLSALDWSTYPNEFIYKTIDVADREDTDITQYFDECFDFIDEAKRLGGGVLVHCFVGRSRSVTIVVAYLMKKYHMSLSQALDHVRSKRPQAAPNSGFVLQLQNFEKSLQVLFNPDQYAMVFEAPIEEQQKKKRTEDADTNRLKKRKERVVSIPPGGVSGVETGGPSLLRREELVPYRPNWAINTTDSALSEVRVAKELVEGIRLPIDRAAVREKTTEEVIGASHQVAASVVLHVGELCDRLKMTMELNHSLEDEKNKAKAKWARSQREMQAVMDKLGAAQNEFRKLSLSLKNARRELKRVGKQAVAEYLESAEHRKMVLDSSAIAYSLGIYSILDHLKAIYPDIEVGAEFRMPPRNTKRGFVRGDAAK